VIDVAHWSQSPLVTWADPDRLSCVGQVSMWEQITKALAGLGLEAVELEKRESMSLEDEDQLVEYEGMLVSAAAAQRRR
jgi:hypothetical protein